MATQQQQITFAVGEDVSDTMTMYNQDGSSTLSVTGWALELVVSIPGGANLFTLSTAAGSMTAGSPAPCYALIHFADSVTVNVPPNYYNFSIRRTDAGFIGETTTGTLMLTP